MSLLILVVLLVALGLSKAIDGPEIPSFACNDYNNDCLGCIQAAPNMVSQCTYCPIDQVCHTVGSLFNKCDDSECISLCKTSSCEHKDAASCDAYNAYGYKSEQFNATRS